MVTSLRLLAAATALFLCTSCQKEASFETATGSNITGSVSGTLKMKTNGVQWTADRATGGSIMNGVINISGIGKDKKYFTIILRDTLTGTYKLYANSFHVAVLVDSSKADPGAYTTNQSDDSSLAGGTVTVASIDRINKTITGSFAFKMFRQADSTKVVITEGVFEKLSYATTLSPVNTTDSLHVKVDGVLWTAKVIYPISFGGSLIINATNVTASTSVGLQLPDNIGLGTYDFSFFGTYAGTYAPNTTTAVMSDSGKITIIERNTTSKRLRGSFNFMASPLLGGATYHLTEGYFSVKLP